MSRLGVGILRMLLAGGAYILGSVDDSTIGLSDTRCYCFRGYRSGGGVYLSAGGWAPDLLGL